MKTRCQVKVTELPLGDNSISNNPKKIAPYLKLNSLEIFTRHFFQTTAVTLLANKGLVL